MSKPIGQFTSLMGIPIVEVNVRSLITEILSAVYNGRHIVVAHLNIHAANLAYEQSELYSFFQHADLLFCDGFGIKIGGYLLGKPIRHRLTPPDWIGELCAQCAQHHVSLFLLGADAGVANRAAGHLQNQYPNLKIAGVHHGFFNKQPEHPENLQVIQMINAAKPDILLVAFGMPLQELWLHHNWNQIDAHVAMTVGALFDYVAGEVRRPPRWMTDHGLEWFGRLIIEPQRLWRRYIIGNPRFFWRLLKYRLSIRPKHISRP